MPKVIADITMSLDGYVTGPGADEQHGLGDAPELHTWVTEQDAVDTEILERATAQSGAVVMGRTSFDKTVHEWGPGGPVPGCRNFVVTHNAPYEDHPGYTFVTDGVASAIEQAQKAAGDKWVGLHGATVMQQGLPLGLVDEIRVHVIPVLLGGGTPLFAHLDSAISLERTSVLATPAATHLGFRVVR